MGYQGSSRTVRRWLEPLCSSPGQAPAITEAHSVRQVNGWLMRHPDSVSGDEMLRLERVLARRPELAVAAERVRAFGATMTSLDGQRLPPVDRRHLGRGRGATASVRPQSR